MATEERVIEIPDDFAEALERTKNDLRHYPRAFVERFRRFGDIMDVDDVAEALGIGPAAVRRMIMNTASSYGPEQIPKFPKIMLSLSNSPFNRPRWAWPTTALAAWAARTRRVDALTGETIQIRGRQARGRGMKEGETNEPVAA